MKFEQFVSGLVLLLVGALIGGAGTAYYADQLMHEAQQQMHADAISLGAGTYAINPLTGKQSFYFVGEKSPDHTRIKREVEELLAKRASK